MASSRELKIQSYPKKIIKKILDLFGYELKRKNNFFDRWGDFIAEANIDDIKRLDFYNKICLATKPNLWSIYQSLKYICNEKIAGDIVECGVYNGNTLSYIGNIINEFNLKKNIWGYDTFDGFVLDLFSEYDIDLKSKKKVSHTSQDVSYSLDEVKKNILKNDKVNFNKYILIDGDVMKTLEYEKNLPKKISFLRLDTDIYATTKKQLEILYPRLSNGGVLHIDDYGMHPGVKKAVDDYFSNSNIWLHRVDLTCRYMIKK